MTNKKKSDARNVLADSTQVIDEGKDNPQTSTVPADSNQQTTEIDSLSLPSKITNAIAQPCRYILQEGKNLYYLGKEAKKNFDPALKTTGHLIYDVCMASHENWKTKELQRKFMETQVMEQIVLTEAGNFIQANPFPQAVPIDTSDTTNFRIRTVGIGMYEIFIPLKSPQKLPNGLFPHHTTDKLNEALENARLWWDSTHNPAEPRPNLYYMKIAGMYQPNNAAAVIRIRLLQW